MLTAGKIFVLNNRLNPHANKKTGIKNEAMPNPL